MRQNRPTSPARPSSWALQNEKWPQKALQAGLATHNPETNHIKLRGPITLIQAKQFATDLRSLIDTQDAARHLGLNKGVFEQLVRRGFINSSRKTPRGPWQFKHGDLHAFVKKALSKATVQARVSDITPIAEVAKSLRCKSEQIFSLLLTGGLETVVRLDKNHTLQGLGVSLNEVRDLTTCPPEIGYSRIDTAAKLRVKMEAVKRLQDIGLLREKLIRFGDHGRTAHVVAAQSIEKLNAKYISLGKFTHIQNRAPGPLVMQLRAAKVLPHKDVHEVENVYIRSEVFGPR